MVKSKLFKCVILSCAIISYKPAQAFWPVMDFGEIPEIVSNVTTSSASLNQNIGQLIELNDALKAMGTSIDNLAQFGQDLRNTVSNIQDVTNSAVDGANEISGADIETPEIINNGFDTTNDLLGEGLDGVINDTQNALNTGEKMIDKGNSGMTSFQETAKKADEGMKKLEEKNEAEKAKREKKKQEEEKAKQQEQNQQTTEPVEEEEEEEEIPDNSETEGLQEEIMANIESYEEDSKQIIAQMNDILDTSINTLNKSAKKIDEILENWENSVKETEQLEQNDKDILSKKIADLRIKQQNLSDKRIALIENAKENYNAECQSKLLDGISNYKKAIESYFRGDITKENLTKQGEDLKTVMVQMDTLIDKDTIAQQRKEFNNIKEEMQAIALEINKKKKQE